MCLEGCSSSPDSKKGDSSHYADPCADCKKTSLHVQVKHETTKHPMEDIDVSVSGKPSLVTAKDGWAKWDPIAPGTYDVTARDDSCEPDPAKEDGVEVVLGEDWKVYLFLKPLEWRLHVDADRDGTVDADWTDGEKWTPGKGKKGAVVLVNSDKDDPGRSGRDYEDSKVNTAADVPDLSPLDLRRTLKGKTFPKGTKATLEVSDRNKLRIFDSRTAGGKEIIGPKKKKKTWKHSEMVDLVELGMEGIAYNAKPGDKGEVTLTLTVEYKGTKQYEQKVTVRIAPFMIFNHLQKTKRVHVIDVDDNKTFTGELDKVVVAGGATLQKAKKAAYGGDRWLQDVMEPGFSSHSAGGLRSVPAILQSKQTRAIGKYPKGELLGKDRGWLYWKAPPAGRPTHDSYGNLECAPPYKVKGGKDYKFGRMIYGTAVPGMDPEVVKFLEAQIIQEPIGVDTSWLRVGHVDEFMSFLPWSGGSHGYALVLASPKAALDILKDKGTSKTAKLTRGFAAPDGPGGAAEKTRIEGRYPFDTVDAFLKNAPIVAVQATVQAKIDAVEAQLTKELSLKKSDIVKLPTLFEEKAVGTGQHIAYTAGCVNMLVVTKSKKTAELAVPKPFGPTKGGKCLFEKEVLSKLAGIGYSAGSVHFIDDFCTYHALAGEIHCGTNSEREPPTDKWWELDWI